MPGIASRAILQFRPEKSLLWSTDFGTLSAPYGRISTYTLHASKHTRKLENLPVRCESVCQILVACQGERWRRRLRRGHGCPRLGLSHLTFDSGRNCPRIWLGVPCIGRSLSRTATENLFFLMQNHGKEPVQAQFFSNASVTLTLSQIQIKILKPASVESLGYVGVNVQFFCLTNSWASNNRHNTNIRSNYCGLFSNKTRSRKIKYKPCMTFDLNHAPDRRILALIDWFYSVFVFCWYRPPLHAER